MQREKLYNLYRTTDFTVVTFVFKIDKYMFLFDGLNKINFF